MAEHNSGPPGMDLDEILRTLSNLQQTPALQTNEQGNASTNAQGPAPTDTVNTYTPPSAHSYPQNHASDPRLQGRTQPQQRISTPVNPSPVPRTSTPSIDSSFITEWKHGLRAVSKLATQNPAFEASIQKMLADQKRNVKDWESGRRRLLEEHTSKRDIEQSQRAAISIPGLLDNAPVLRTKEREQEELAQYHQKVYRASKHMAVSHSAELKRQGVPFFGTRAEVVRADDGEGNSVEEDEIPAPDADGKITKSQLVALQRKMLNHLVELYGD